MRLRRRRTARHSERLRLQEWLRAQGDMRHQASGEAGERKHNEMSGGLMSKNTTATIRRGLKKDGEHSAGT